MLGLRPATDYELTATFTDADGATLTAAPMAFTSRPLPVVLPRFEVIAHHPDRREPGLLLFLARTGDKRSHVFVALDEALQVVWWFVPDEAFGDVRQTEAGALIGLSDGEAVELDLFGESLRRFAPDLDGEPHHELFPLRDGSFLSAVPELVEVPAYPEHISDPAGAAAPAEITDHRIVRFDETGALRMDFALSERLDTGRISYDGRDMGPAGGFDWAHVNGVVPDPRDRGVVVSMRHQDAVAKFDASGALMWILGDPAGWDAAFLPSLLRPVGSLEWPYHQHAPEMGDDGVLLLFDNHNRGHTPYTDEPDQDPRSRVVAFRVDEDRMTVEQVWQFSDTTTGPLLATAMGDADRLPRTGNVLAVFGYLSAEGGVSNRERGWGDLSARILEIDRDRPEDPPLDLRVYAPRAAEPSGWRIYRAESVPTLYPPGVTVERLQ